MHAPKNTLPHPIYLLIFTAMLWILGDSRCRGLEEYIQENGLDDINVTICSGKTLGYLCHTALNQLITNPPSTKTDIVFAAGINDITTKNSKIMHVNHHLNINSFCDSIEHFHEQIMSFPIVKSVSFATIPSCSFRKYQEHQLKMGRINESLKSEVELREEQNHLNNCLDNINEFITEFNTTNNVCTIKLHKDLLKISKKRRGAKTMKVLKYSFKHLFDGLHPDAHLKIVWFFLLSTFKAKITITTSSSSDSDDTEEDSWDFKRKL